MVNHLRTLLANLDPLPGVIDYPGEEYIDPAFRSLGGLPREVSLLRTAWFGYAPDRCRVNWIVRELLALVDAAGLRDYALWADRRTTYDPDGRRLQLRYVRSPRVSQTGGVSTPIYVTVPAAERRSDSVGIRRWSLLVTDSTHLRVAVEDKITGAILSTETIAFTATGGYSGPVLLTDSAVEVRVGNATGAAWGIELVSRPTDSLADRLVAAESAGEATADFWFGESPTTSPMRELRAIWSSHERRVNRQAALVAAYGLRITEGV